MNSAKTLYTLLNVLFVLLIFSIGISILFAILIGVGLDVSFVSTDSEVLEYTNDSLFYVFAVLLLIIYGIFCYGIWQLRKAASIFMTKAFYTESAVRVLAMAGKSFVITGIFAWVIDGLSNIHFNSEISLSLSDKTFMYLFLTSIGLFILLMSAVIKDAMSLKEENDLTV